MKREMSVRQMTTTCLEECPCAVPWIILRKCLRVTSIFFFKYPYKYNLYAALLNFPKNVLFLQNPPDTSDTAGHGRTWVAPERN